MKEKFNEIKEKIGKEEEKSIKERITNLNLSKSLDVIDKTLRNADSDLKKSKSTYTYEGWIKRVGINKTILKEIINSAETDKPYKEIIKLVRSFGRLKEWAEQKQNKSFKDYNKFDQAVNSALESSRETWRKIIKEQYKEPKSGEEIIGVSWGEMGSGNYRIGCSNAQGIEHGIDYDEDTTPSSLTEKIYEENPLTVVREECEDRDASAPSYYIGGEFLFSTWDRDLEEIKKHLKESINNLDKKED